MKSCIKCKHYSMAAEEDRGRTSFDFCEKKGELPTSAFSLTMCVAEMEHVLTFVPSSVWKK